MIELNLLLFLVTTVLYISIVHQLFLFRGENER